MPRARLEPVLSPLPGQAKPSNQSVTVLYDYIQIKLKLRKIVKIVNKPNLIKLIISVAVTMAEWIESEKQNPNFSKRYNTWNDYRLVSCTLQ